MPTGRRDLLRGACLTPLAAALSGCAALEAVNPLANPIRVAVTWSGDELVAFRRVLDAYERISNEQAHAISFGDEIETALSARASGSPDIIMLPRIGALMDPDVRRNLQPIVADGLADKASWPKRFVLTWDDLWYDDRPYGIPFKVTNKSVVWFRQDVLTEYGHAIPLDWTSWVGLVERLAANPRLLPDGMAPLAIAGADEWMLTDFFENVLLGVHSEADALRNKAKARMWESSTLRTALHRLGAMWSVENAIAGGAEWALVRQFHDAVLDVFSYDRAAMVVAPDFAYPVITKFAHANATPGSFRFPAMDRALPPRTLVGGDVAVLARPADKRAIDLVRWLATAEAQLAWIGGREARERDVRIDTPIGFVPANLRACQGNANLPSFDWEVCPTPILRPNDPQDPAEPTFAFDPSDQMGITGVLGRGMQDFLVRVAGNPDQVRPATRQVLDTLREAGAP